MTTNELPDNEETVLATTSECNHCGWQGPITQVKFNNGIFYCPSCDQEFGPPEGDHSDHEDDE